MIGNATAPGFFARQVFSRLAEIAHADLQMEVGGGRRRSFGNPQAGLQGRITVHDRRAFRRICLGSDLGFAESYLRGEWDSPDLTCLLQAMGKLPATNVRSGRSLAALTKKIARATHLLNDNSLRGARRNMAFHYDLGNDFYRLWLDSSMTYSCGRFRGAADRDLAAAQQRKYRRIAELAGMDGGSGRVLELGCGWGGFARSAAGRDCSTLGITLSRRQLEHARAAATGPYRRQMQFELIDYRKVGGSFDAIVSIEMFEAVGERHWKDFFSVIRERLRPGGRAALQIITIANERFARYRREVDFIQRYIFPGGCLISPARLHREIRRAGLVLEHEEFFAEDYATTLALWRSAFAAAWPQISELGFDDRFRRMWTYYLSYCEAGFRNRITNVGAFRVARPG